MAAANIVVDKHSPDEFDKLSLPENLGDTTEIQQGRTYFSAGSVLKVSKSQKHFFLKLHCPKNERNI